MPKELSREGRSTRLLVLCGSYAHIQPDMPLLPPSPPPPPGCHDIWEYGTDLPATNGPGSGSQHTPSPPALLGLPNYSLVLSLPALSIVMCLDPLRHSYLWISRFVVHFVGACISGGLRGL